LLRAIQVSVDELDQVTRARYLDLAVVPDDTAIPAAALAVLWKLAPPEVDDIVDSLADLSLATWGNDRKVTIHDLQADYVRHSQKDVLPELHQKFLECYGRVCTGGWPSGPNDGYFSVFTLSLAASVCQELRAPLIDFGGSKLSSIQSMLTRFCRITIICRMPMNWFVCSVFFD
jgi:hypothetical protein